MSNFSTIDHHQLTELSQTIWELLSTTPYNPPPSHDVSIKSLIESLLPPKTLEKSSTFVSQPQVRDFSMCCALLSSAIDSNSPYTNWIPQQLSIAANNAFRALSKAIYGDSDELLSSEKKLVIELMPEVLPLIKNTIKESSTSGSDDGDEITAASARVPLGYAIVAAYQFRWFVSQVDYPHLGKKNNPRSTWYEKLLNEMLGHLERQPRDKERRIIWLRHIEPLFSCMGLVLLAHFRRLFPLLFHWIHADDNETVLLVLEKICAIVKLTWIRSSPHTVRLVDELAILYKEAAMKTACEEIRSRICQIFILLQQCKGLHFNTTWEKYKDDQNLRTLVQSISGNATTVTQ